MSEAHANVAQIASELNISPDQVRAVLDLLADGATVPFIARYRKEATGTLDEVQVTRIRDREQQLVEFEKRRRAILDSLTERSLLTDELGKRIAGATTLTELEDIYLPYRPKRKTRASQARERGLEPLATKIFKGESLDLEADSKQFLNADKGVATTDDALAGARDIIAEWINEDEATRKEVRRLWSKKCAIDSVVVKGKENDGAKFKDYFDWTEPIAGMPSHRILAILRGEAEGMLKVKLTVPEEEAHQIVERRFVKGKGPSWDQCGLAGQDAYKRLLAPSLETEFRSSLKERADVEAIQVFVSNVRELLMAPPLGQKAVLAIDPGFRTGCKIVCLDRQGALLHNDVFYLHDEKPDGTGKGGVKILSLVKKYSVEAIAVGNGTASRETESFLRALDFKKAGLDSPPVVMVNESGASIYSASETAREEFPNHDITVRGAVSIGRRLMDPLAELVKIDPKSIGVGQYQHDVDQSQLQKSLDDTVVSCVNAVGVELNTASKQLLTYVSGLGPQLAANIVKHRDEKGAFKSRAELKRVARLGPKAFEQCAGFLRIRDAKNPLDASAVHPERYAVVEQMAKDIGCDVLAIMKDEALRKKIDIKKYVTENVGVPTLKDILSELEKPGRDPRAKLEPVRFSEEVHSLDDLKEGMKLPGIVTNVTAFGAFVDIGVHQDGLVHVSELADRFVKDPATVVKVNQAVKVTVLQVDKERKRISLSMKR